MEEKNTLEIQMGAGCFGEPDILPLASPFGSFGSGFALHRVLPIISVLQ
jgi:hypothetical protein